MKLNGNLIRPYQVSMSNIRISGGLLDSDLHLLPKLGQEVASMRPEQLVVLNRWLNRCKIVLNFSAHGPSRNIKQVQEVTAKPLEWRDLYYRWHTRRLTEKEEQIILKKVLRIKYF